MQLARVNAVQMPVVGSTPAREGSCWNRQIAKKEGASGGAVETVSPIRALRKKGCEVPPRGFEPLISTLKGWRPRPLDDGGPNRGPSLARRAEWTGAPRWSGAPDHR